MPDAPVPVPTPAAVTLQALHLYPVKSCAGIAPLRARLGQTGLDLDREWMVVDAQGRFVSQREQPRLALVRTSLRGGDLLLKAPGMLTLHVRLDAVEGATEVRIRDDTLQAWDMGALAAQWFSDFLQRPLRLARFDPEQRRLSDRRWTGELEAENAFSDAFPLLVASTASLAELNRRLAQQGQPAVTMERFRPNLVLDGLDAHDEDFVRELRIETDEGPVVLRLVKPCVRCTIPNVDPASAVVGDEPGRTLAGYRADPRVAGGVTFGMNAVVVDGIGRELRVGQPVQVDLGV